jgi:hypothetical protein
MVTSSEAFDRLVIAFAVGVTRLARLRGMPIRRPVKLEDGVRSLCTREGPRGRAEADGD